MVRNESSSTETKLVCHFPIGIAIWSKQLVTPEERNCHKNTLRSTRERGVPTQEVKYSYKCSQLSPVMSTM